MGNFEKIAFSLREEVLRTIYKAQTSHIGSNLSCVDILTVLWFCFLRDWDHFIMSKGHAAAILYHILAKKRYFKKEELENYCKMPTKFLGLVNSEVPGVEFSTGSLGHGLPAACGIAWMLKKNKQRGRVYCLISDGEIDCGTTWESALFAAHHHLNNLTLIVDYNKLQAFGETNKVLNLEPLSEKFKSFNWRAIEINGHSFAQLQMVFKHTLSQKEMPLCIIAHTIKGKGVRFMENKIGWHYWNIQRYQYYRALKQLKNHYAKSIYSKFGEVSKK